MPDLKTIVQKMIDADESDEDIDAVVKRFKELNPPKPSSSPVSPSEPDTFAGGVLKSLGSGEAFKSSMQGGLGWLKGAVLDLPETVIGAVKDFATSASDIPKMLRDAPGAIRHGIPAMGQQMKETFDQAGSDPDAFGRMMGQLTGQPLVTEGIIRSAPLARKPVGAAIEGTGRVMRRHQPVSGMMPRFGEMRTMRNVERGVGSGIEKLGQMIRPKPEPTPPNFTGSGTPSQFTPGSDYNIDLNQPVPSNMGGPPTGTGSGNRLSRFPRASSTEHSFEAPVPRSNTTGSGMPSQFTEGPKKTAPPAIPAAPSKFGGAPTGSGTPSKFNQGPARVPEAPPPPSPFGVSTGSGMPSKFTPGRPNTDAIIPPVPETFPGPMTRQQIVPENIDLNTSEIIEPLRAKKTKGNWRSTLSKLAKDDTGSAEMPEWVNSFFDEDLGTIPTEKIDLNAEVSKLGRAESITPEDWGNWGDLNATKEALPDLINDASGSTVAAKSLNPEFDARQQAMIDDTARMDFENKNRPFDQRRADDSAQWSRRQKNSALQEGRNPQDPFGEPTAVQQQIRDSYERVRNYDPEYHEWFSEQEALLPEGEFFKPDAARKAAHDEGYARIQDEHNALVDRLTGGFEKPPLADIDVRPTAPKKQLAGVNPLRLEIPEGQLTNKRMFELSEQRGLENQVNPGRQFADSVSPNEFSEDMMFAPDELINPDIPEMMSPFENQFDPRIAPGGGENILDGARDSFTVQQELREGGVPPRMATTDLIKIQDQPGRIKNIAANERPTIDALKADITERGIVKPVIVRQTPEGHYMVEDGHHRIVAARELGIEDIDVIVGEKGQRSSPSGENILEGARETFGRRQEPDIANDMSQRQGPRQTQMPPSRDVTPEAPAPGQPRLIKEDGTKVKPVGAKGEAFKVTDPNGKHLGDIEITEAQIAEVQAHPELSDIPREEIIKSIYDAQYETIMEQHGIAENARSRVKVESKDARLKRTPVTELAGEPTFSTTKAPPKNPLDPDAAFAPDGDIIPIAREKRILDRDQSTDLRYKPLLPAEMRTALGEGETFKGRLENLLEASKPLDDPDLIQRSAERDAFIKSVVGDPDTPPLRSKKTVFKKPGRFANFN